MIRERRRRHRSRLRRFRRWGLIAGLVLVMFGAVAGFRGYQYYRMYKDVESARSAVVDARKSLDLGSLSLSDDRLVQLQVEMTQAQETFASASHMLNGDPFVWLAGKLPKVGKQVAAAQALAAMGSDASAVGVRAVGLLRDYKLQDTSGQQFLQAAVTFLDGADLPMIEISQRLDSIRQRRQEISTDGLLGPLADGVTEMDDGITQIESTLQDYQRAHAFIPLLLGYDHPRTYVVIPQNNTELFPSGGLMSTFSAVTFDKGAFQRGNFQYFGTLSTTGAQKGSPNYVTPPAPLRDYLLRDTGWELAEAGWFPDFPRSAAQAQALIEKGGGPKSEGVIAVDLIFVEELLKILGPVNVAQYNETVSSADVTELTLEQTRGSDKSFLSAMAAQVLDQLQHASKSQLSELLQFLGRMVDERHLTVYFNDPQLEDLAQQMGWTGAMPVPQGDFLSLQETSVLSTKLNLILQESIAVNIEPQADGRLLHRVTVSYFNPFSAWAKGKDPELVSALMLDGVYGAYVRLYAPLHSEIQDVQLDGTSVGLEDVNNDAGFTSFERFISVGPDEHHQLTFVYLTPQPLTKVGRVAQYSLTVRKEAGTRSIPLTISLTPPQGTEIRQVKVDGSTVPPQTTITSDLTTDRQLEVTFESP